MEPDGDTDLLPLADAAEVVGISLKTLDRWVRWGIIEAEVAEDGRRLIRRSELARHVVRMRGPHPPDG